MADGTQVPVKNSVKQWNHHGPKPIVLIKNKSSLIISESFRIIDLFVDTIEA